MTSEKPTSVRWNIFIALLILCTINYVDRAVLSICMPAIQKDLSLDPAVIGVVLSAFFWGYALMQIPAGWLVDRVRPDKLILASGIGWGIFQMFTGFVSSSSAFSFFRVLLGIAESPIYPAGAKLQSVWLTSKERGRGAALLDSGAALGNAIGGPLVIIFMSWFGGWRGALIGAGVVTIAVVLVCWKTIKGTPETNPNVNEAERQYISKALEEEYALAKIASGQSKPVKWTAYATSLSFWMMLTGFIGIDGFWYGLMTWGPMYLAQTQHLNINSLGGSVFLIFGVGVIGELAGGWFADRWRNRGGKFNTVMRTMLVIEGLVMAGGMYFLTTATTLLAAISILCFTMFFMRQSGCLWWNVPAAISQRAHVGTVAGIMNFVGNMAGVVTPIIVGMIVSTTGSYFGALMLFMAYGLMVCVSAMLLQFDKKIGSDVSTDAKTTVSV